jgi:iron complex transport system substrate-binding protein
VRALRICSLLPSATEIVAVLGLVDRLVGRSAECDFPPTVSRLPVVTSARIDTENLTSAAIDAAVRDALADERSLYAVDADLIAQLAPDLILTQDLCEVCAVASGDGALCALGIETLALDAHSLDEIARSILLLAARLGVPARGQGVVAAMEAKITLARARAHGLPARRVFVSEWLDPPFAAGHWLPEMVVAAGGVEVLGQPGQPSFRTSWEAVRQLEPELVVLACCGFDVDRTVREVTRAGVPNLGCPIVAVDANAYYSRPASRVADGVMQLVHLFHPDVAPRTRSCPTTGSAAWLALAARAAPSPPPLARRLALRKCDWHRSAVSSGSLGADRKGELDLSRQSNGRPGRKL